MLTQERLKELLHYDPETGLFKNIAPRKKVKPNSIAGHLDPSIGYVGITIDKRKYYAHRLAFLYMTGSFPKNIVDHVDGDGANNKWKNLRDVSRTINQQNIKRASKISSTGLLGAYKKRNKFCSAIKVNKIIVRLGSFDTALESHIAYVNAKRKYHEGCTI